MNTVIELFKKDNFAKACGIEIEEVSPGFARCSMKVTENHLNGNEKSGSYEVVITNDENEIIAQVNGTTSFARNKVQC